MGASKVQENHSDTHGGNSLKYVAQKQKQDRQCLKQIGGQEVVPNSSPQTFTIAVEYTPSNSYNEPMEHHISKEGCIDAENTSLIWEGDFKKNKISEP